MCNLVANGVQDTTFEVLQSCYEKYEKVPQVMHETLLKLFATYIVVGGKPVWLCHHIMSQNRRLPNLKILLTAQ